MYPTISKAAFNHPNRAVNLWSAGSFSFIIRHNIEVVFLKILKNFFKKRFMTSLQKRCSAKIVLHATELKNSEQRTSIAIFLELLNLHYFRDVALRKCLDG